MQRRATEVQEIVVGHGIALGGVGSDLFPADAPDEYWMVTDRGPNGQVKLKGPNRRTFPVPQFDPLILRVRAQAGAPLTILQVIPVTTTDGSPVSGLPNDAARDETPYDWTANTELPLNPSGLDTEGLVRTPNGEFWLAEEYSPSLLHVSATGTVLGRLVPQGLALPGAGYPVTDSLPAVFADRQGNRGFESLALGPDGTTLYTAVQSPLADPDAKSGKTSRAVRVLAVDTASGRPTAEYVYPLEDVAGFDPGAEGDQSQMKVSAMAWSGDQLVVDERTDAITKLYLVRLPGTTNILGGELDDPAHAPKPGARHAGRRRPAGQVTAARRDGRGAERANQDRGHRRAGSVDGGAGQRQRLRHAGRCRRLRRERTPERHRGPVAATGTAPARALTSRSTPAANAVWSTGCPPTTTAGPPTRS
jgi:hypothetical protein